jgi:hypothetical protein
MTGKVCDLVVMTGRVKPAMSVSLTRADEVGSDVYAMELLSILGPVTVVLSIEDKCEECIEDTEG